ncbi:MAG: exodeoxyribonuclease VII large subunit [Pseudohongiellaceae bacterium]
MSDLFNSASLAAPDVFSVSELNRQARGLLEGRFPDVAVEGEISNFVCPASGHWYFTLKDKHSQLRCAMFARSNRLLRFQPKDGMQVVLRGQLSIYEGRGEYQIIAKTMVESGVGALQRAFEELKAGLQAEGLFDEKHKEEVGNLYQHVGIITSRTGAAIHDMLTVFARRFPATRITLIPVAVQGKEAAAEIVHAIKVANRLRQKLGLQALIVGRGGGSLEDLQAFNDEAVARAIFASELPVVSAVGHEIDFTIADFVADLRAPTPSAAAEQMSLDQDDLLEELMAYQHQFAQMVKRKLASVGQSLATLRRHLKRPDQRLQERAQHLDNMDIRLRRAMQSVRQQLKAQLAELSRSLQAMSPLHTLGRGYSISFDEARKPIRDAKQMKAGSRMISLVGKGQITSTVESVSSLSNEKALRDIT